MLRAVYLSSGMNKYTDEEARMFYGTYRYLLRK
jgi:hypothetical protein